MNSALGTWHETERVNRRRSALITGVITALLLLLFFWLGLYTPFPPPAEEGILIDFGYEDAGRGPVEPVSAQRSVPVETSQAAAAAEENLTQDIEESVALPEETEQVEQPLPDPKPEPVENTPQPEEAPVEPVVEEPVIDQSLLFSSDRHDFSSQSQSEGDRDGVGNMGDPSGSESDNYFGDQSTGLGDDGLGYSLAGRNMTRRPPVDKDFQEQGTLVIAIEVNREGAVTRAVYERRGSTITDPALIRKYEALARKAQFSRKADAPDLQRGTITFQLKLR